MKVATLTACEIITGDCIEELKRLADGSAALVFADPPYNIGIEYDDYKDSMDDRSYRAWCDRWIAECARVLSPSGSMWILINDEHAAHMAISMQAAGLHQRSWVIWYETFGVNCTRKFNRTKRHLLYAVKNKGRFTFNRDAVTVPSARQLKYGDKRANPNGKVMDDVWTIPRVCGTYRERMKGFHTQLPLELLRRVIGCCSNPGDTVIDPFSGSGTTAVACIELSRHCVGIERSATYAELSRARINGDLTSLTTNTKVT